MYRKILVLLLLFVGSVATIQAQSKEIAHINMEELLRLMPEMQRAEAELKRTEEAYREDFQTSYREYQAKYIKYDEEKEGLTPQQQSKQENDLQLIERNLAQTQRNIDEQIAEKRKVLIAPIKEKAEEVVNQVAEAQGFFYVLDSSAESGLIRAKGKNLLADVKRTMGL